MFWRVLAGSLRHQRARLGIVALAMALGSTLVSGLLNLSGDIGGQVGQQLRAYGANILVRPVARAVTVGSGDMEFGTVAAAQTIAEADLEPVRQVEGVIGAIPYLSALVEVDRQPAILAGVDLPAARTLNTWWQVQGRWPAAAEEILVGARAAAALGLAPGRLLQVRYGDVTQVSRVVGILDTGGEEDDQLIASLPLAQRLTGQPGAVGLVMVSALAKERSLEAIVGELQAALPDADVRTLAQFAKAESNVLSKVRLLIGLVAALVMIAGALTVGGTLNTVMMERRHEIGLMKALGASDGRVAKLFFAEALSVGAIGAAIGYLSGLALAMAVGRRVFETTIAPTPWGLPGTMLVGLAVVLVAALFPVQRALQVDPVRTLRGE